MSYMKANELYMGVGGGATSSNYVNISSIYLLYSVPTTSVAAALDLGAIQPPESPARN